MYIFMPHILYYRLFEEFQKNLYDVDQDEKFPGRGFVAPLFEGRIDFSSLVNYYKTKHL